MQNGTQEHKLLERKQRIAEAGSEERQYLQTGGQDTSTIDYTLKFKCTSMVSRLSISGIGIKRSAVLMVLRCEDRLFFAAGSHLGMLDVELDISSNFLLNFRSLSPFARCSLSQSKRWMPSLPKEHAFTETCTARIIWTVLLRPREGKPFVLFNEKSRIATMHLCVGHSQQTKSARFCKASSLAALLVLMGSTMSFTNCLAWNCLQSSPQLRIPSCSTPHCSLVTCRRALSSCSTRKVIGTF